ncbi:MAG: methionine transporter substrate-binding protein, partial [Bacteroidota bacterium]|nr:methionine transporter substrate-binding protein [Bacteroidota bacterium]
AAQTENMESGAMAFDRAQLKPLYQLQTGMPGSSFTFEIAKKSGLQEHIIKNAENKTGDKKVLDEVLSDIQVEKQFIKGLRKNVQVKESQLEDLTKSYEELNKEMQKEKKRLLKQYEARLLERFNEESRNLENEMRAWKEQKNDKEKFLNVREHIDQNREQIEKKLDDVAVELKPADEMKIKIGTKVRLEEGTEVGEVMDVKNNNAVVAFGNIQTKVRLDHLVAVNENKKAEPKRNTYSSKIILEKSEFDYNLDIRGLMKDEALTAIDNFMDKAVMYGIHHLKIIHGRGTGALKQAVQYYLKKYPHVKEFHYENEQFGGDGITIVEMK